MGTMAYGQEPLVVQWYCSIILNGDIYPRQLNENGKTFTCLPKGLSGSKFEECSKLRRNMHFNLPDHEEPVGLSNAAECGQIPGAT